MSDAGKEAFGAAMRGDLSEAAAVADALFGDADPRAHAWSLALRAALACTLADAPPPDLDALVGVAGAAPVPATLAARQRALAALLAHDADALGRAVDALARLTELAAGPLADASHGLARAGLRWLRGEEAEPPAIAPVAAAIDPSLQVEHVSLRALQSLAEGHVATGVASARQASRMAAADGVLQAEYLANLVLARARRRSGRGHLALRILTALRAVVPPTWERWVGLELGLAGALDMAPWAAVDAALDVGDRAAFDAALGGLLGGPLAAPLRRELIAWRGLTDPAAEPGVDAGPWVRGEAHEVPFGIVDGARSLLSPAFVVATAAGARRVLARGLSLVVEDAWRPEPIAQTRRNHHTLAALALAGAEGLEAPALFAEVYGFAFDEPQHAEVLRGLVHRARAELGDAGDIVREGARVGLAVRRALAVPDPRAERSLADQVLGFLAGGAGRATAREIASALRVPLRSVQRAVGALVEEGGCLAEPDGRRVEYVVEDTTFHQPTLHRLRGRR